MEPESNEDSATTAPPASDPINAAAPALSTGYRTMLGFDGSTVEEAARAAYTPTGPPIAELERRIRERRERPAQFRPAPPK